MNNPSEPYRSITFFGLSCLLLAGLIAWEWHSIGLHALNTDTANASSAEELTRTSDEPNAVLPLQNYQAIVKDPLFFAGREEAPETTTTTENGNLRLAGIVLAPQGFLALIRDEKGQYYRLDKGNDVQGWTVTDVQQDRVSLVRNSETLDLLLFEANANTHDLTAKELEECFKNSVDRPLKDCLEHPGKPAAKAE